MTKTTAEEKEHKGLFQFAKSIFMIPKTFGIICSEMMRLRLKFSENVCPVAFSIKTNTTFKTSSYMIVIV